jgi:hypothetical protein
MGYYFTSANDKEQGAQFAVTQEIVPFDQEIPF